MKALSIGGPESGSGKTLTSMIIIRGLKNQNIDLGGVKAGPDYVDSILLAKAGKKSRANIDLHLQGKEGIKRALGLVDANYLLIEGAMGYFDGIGRGYQGSCYDLSRILDIDSILVYQQKGEMYTMVPKIQGMINQSQGRIKGLILTNTSEKMYNLVKDMLEENLNIDLLGYIERHKDLEKLSASIDQELMVQGQEFDQILDQAANRSYETLDYEKILNLFKDLGEINISKGKNSGLTIAIAKDPCFFYLYGENEKILKEYFNIKYFSPLKDKNLPDCDLLYIGGGYPENYIDELSSNKSMINSIRSYHKSRGHIYAEAGGMVYLTNSFMGRELVGILDGVSIMNKRLQNFGYSRVTTLKDSILGPKGTSYSAHEYHRTYIKTDNPHILKVYKASRDENIKDGYLIDKALLSYQYINFAGNEHIIENMIKYIKED